MAIPSSPVKSSLHQRPGRGERRLLRPGRSGHRRPAARRAIARRRLELRGRERLDAVVVQHHDLRARSSARGRAVRREQPGSDRGPAPRTGGPSRAPLFRRRSTGEVIDEIARAAPRGHASPSRRGGTTTCCGTGLLAPRRSRARRARVRGDRLVASKRDEDGRWPLETVYPGRMPVDTGRGRGPAEPVDTLRALRVLRWHEQAGP